MEKRSKRLVVSVEPSLARDLRLAASRSRLTISEFTRRAVEADIKRTREGQK